MMNYILFQESPLFFFVSSTDPTKKLFFFFLIPNKFESCSSTKNNKKSDLKTHIEKKFTVGISEWILSY